MSRREKIKDFFQRNKFTIIVIFLFLLFFLALNFNSFNTPWERDEGEYAYSAWMMQHGQPFYVTSFIQKPPLIIYTYYFAQLIKPFALWPPRLLSFLFALASCLLLALIAKKIYGSRGAWLALWISPLFLCFPPLCALAANTEKFMLLPLIGLLALFVFKRGKEKRSTYFWAGVLAAIATLYKPFAFPAAAVLIIYWLAANYLIERNLKKILNSLLIIILGGVSTAFLVFIYPIAHGAMGEFWQQGIIYNFSYAADMKKYFPGQFFHYSGIFWDNLWPVILLIPGAIFFRPKFSGLWSLLLFVSLLSIITTPIGHYYLLLTPFLVLLAAGVYAKISEKIKIKEDAWKSFPIIVFIVIVMSVYFSSLGEQLFLDPQELNLWIYGSENPFVESNLMAGKIKENTKEGEKIFIAGSEPQIYYFSQRESASKFDITYPLNISTPWREDYQKQVVEDLKKNKPAAIVISLRPASSLWEESSPRLFVDYLSKDVAANYYLAGGTALTALGEPIWLEPGDISNQTDISLILYLKK